MAFFWTDERVAELRAMWGTHTAAFIAAHLGDGCTRNAVIGKINRLGMVGKRKADEMSARKQGRMVAAQRAASKPKPVIVKPEAVMICEPVEIARVSPTIFELGDRDCHYIVGRDDERDLATYCGAGAKIGIQYCAEHHRIMWTPRSVSPRPYARYESAVVKVGGHNKRRAA